MRSLKKWVESEDIAKEFWNREKAVRAENKYQNPKGIVLKYLNKKYGAKRMEVIVEHFEL